MIGPADADENMATEDLTSTKDTGLDGETIPTGMPKDQAIPIDLQLQMPSSKSNLAESSAHKKQELAMVSLRLRAKKSEQIVLISSSESSPKPISDQPEFGELTDDEAANTEYVDTAPTDNARASETNTPLSDPDDTLTLAQSLEVNFAAFLNQRRKLEACVKAEKSSAKKNDETIAELKQARHELIERHSRGTHDLRRKVSELEMHLEAAKRALEMAERAEKDSDVSLTELGDKIRGEERSKAEAVERIRQWEATLAKTAFQST
ncbi:hypothetical protein BFJ72_g10113 [Fusarium proliferatum]|uniref:Uncharacterized protein n=1 Tax=Gibberella intermedia TaxID=948311 RepID=A0A420SV06_GIBIN|nr:hypothetical protein BFJ72_g10113 [Fusarium proliferatum]